jgi:hypothetical protein
MHRYARSGCALAAAMRYKAHLGMDTTNAGGQPHSHYPALHCRPDGALETRPSDEMADIPWLWPVLPQALSLIASAMSISSRSFNLTLVCLASRGHRAHVLTDPGCRPRTRVLRGTIRYAARLQILGQSRHAPPCSAISPCYRPVRPLPQGLPFSSGPLFYLPPPPWFEGPVHVHVSPRSHTHTHNHTHATHHEPAQPIIARVLHLQVRRAFMLASSGLI